MIKPECLKLWKPQQIFSLFLCWQVTEWVSWHVIITIWSMKLNESKSYTRDTRGNKLPVAVCNLWPSQLIKWLSLFHLSNRNLWKDEKAVKQPFIPRLLVWQLLYLWCVCKETLQKGRPVKLGQLVLRSQPAGYESLLMLSEPGTIKGAWLLPALQLLLQDGCLVSAPFTRVA